MIDREFLEFLVRLLDDSSLDSLEIERGGMRVRLAKSAPAGATTALVSAPSAMADATGRPPAGPPLSVPSPPASPPPAGSSPPPDDAGTPLTEVTSPMVGTFYRAPSPEADPYVKTGDSVKAGDVLCVIEAMKLMNELECETPGRIVEICVGNAEPVDYGQVLFRVEPA